MSRTIRVHNPGTSAVVFTADGRMLGPFATAEATDGDRVTDRLLRRGRILTPAPPREATNARHRANQAEEEETRQQEPDSPAEPAERPAGNASRDDWEAYALAEGYHREDLDRLGRNDIRDLFDTGQDHTDPPTEGDTSAQEPEATADGEPDSDNEEEQ